MKTLKTLSIGIAISLLFLVIFPGRLAVYPLNPFLIVSMFLGGMLGLRRSNLVSPFFAAAYFYQFYTTLDLQEVESITSYENFVVPFGIIAISGVMGAIGDRYRSVFKQNLKTITDCKETISNLTDTVHQLQQQKTEIEKRVVTQVKTTSKFYDLAQIMESDRPEEIAEAICMLVCEQIAVDNAYVYIKDGEQFKRLNYVDKDVEILPEVITDQSILVTSAILSRRLSTPVNVEGEDKLLGNGMASPLLAEDQSVLGLIVVRNVEYLSFLPTTFSNLDALSSWVEIVLAKSLLENELLKNTLRDRLTGAYSSYYFSKRAADELKLAQDYKTPLKMIRLRILQLDEMTVTRRLIIQKTIAKYLQAHVSDTDVVAIGRETGEFLILVRTQGEDIKNVVHQVIEKSKQLLDLEIKCEYDEISNQDSTQFSSKLDEYGVTLN